MKRIVAFCIILALIIPSAYAASETDKIISETAEYITGTVQNPQISSIGGEWAVIGLYKSGADVPEGYFDRYLKNAEKAVSEADGVLSSRKYTEYSRVALALSVIGKNPENVGGYNLITPICDFDAVTRQGLNGSIWALIALDSGDYGSGEIRGRYVTKILDSEIDGGGWTMSGTDADPDVTAMAITALSKHINEEGVSAAVERGINCLLAIQNDDGGFSTYGEATAESIAQVITALCSANCDFEKFTKNGVTPLDALMRYRKGGGFSHTIGGETNLMATEQSLYALAAVKRQKEGLSPVFAADKKVFSDVTGNETAISALNEKGIMSGMGDGTFAPEKNVTRAEFAVIAVKIMGLDENADCTFSDVHKTDWFYPYVSAAEKSGIVYGVSETEFNPYGEITCEEAATITGRIAEIFEIETDMGETEITGVSAWAVKAYSFCVNAGILDNGKAPKKLMNRAEIAQMMYNMLKKAGRL